MAVRIDHPQPQLRLDLWGGTSGTYAAWAASGGSPISSGLSSQTYLNQRAFEGSLAERPEPNTVGTRRLFV
jgi:hypothetical protein